MRHLAAIALATSLPALAAAVPAPENVKVSYLHSLATTSGTVPLAGPALSYDRDHKELFVVGEGLVRIFNESGMETFEFGDDPDVGSIFGVVPLETGDLLALTQRNGDWCLARLDYRGEFLAQVEPRGVPADYDAGLGGTIRYADGKVYLANLTQMKVLVLKPDGQFVASYDLAKLVGIEDQRADTGIRGFNVDQQGNLLFTIQPLFKAYIASPEGKVTDFGVKGSAPGKFNVVGGIARDEAGNVYVADILKSAILVFDRNLEFLREFGYRGRSQQALAAPDEIAVSEGKVFVSQHARRGVNVYRVVQQ